MPFVIVSIISLLIFTYVPECHVASPICLAFLVCQVIPNLHPLDVTSLNA